MTDKIKTEKAKINLKTNRIQLLNKKNSLVAKREELRAEIIILNTAGSFNVPIYRYQDPTLKLTQDKLKAKRLILFDDIKKNF